MEEAKGIPQIQRPTQSFYARNERLILRWCAIVGFFAAWEALVRLGWIAPRYISSPFLMLVAAHEMVVTGILWRHVWVSALEFFLGFVAAMAVGIPLGILTGWYKRPNYVLDPFVSGLYATPMVALIPVLIIWLGVGIWSKVAVIFLAAVFPIAVNIMAGMGTLDARLVRAARSFGASDAWIFRSVALPATVPFLLAGVRLGMARGLVGIVIGEMYAASAGIGYLISISGTTFQTDRVFVGVALIAGAGIAMSASIRRLEARFEVWRPQAR